LSDSTSNPLDSLDVGAFVSVCPILDDLKYKLLKCTFKLTSCYNFKNDMITGAKREFSVQFLDNVNGLFILLYVKELYANFVCCLNLHLKENYLEHL